MTSEERAAKRRLAIRDTQMKGLAKARKASVEARKEKQNNARSFLQAIAGEINIDDVREVAREVMRQCMAGDPKAREWFGKYLLANGKLDLRELTSPSILKRK